MHFIIFSSIWVRRTCIITFDFIYYYYYYYHYYYWFKTYITLISWLLRLLCIFTFWAEWWMHWFFNDVCYFFRMSSTFSAIKEKLQFSTSATFSAGRKVNLQLILFGRSKVKIMVCIACSKIRTMLILFITYLMCV